ncbi:hypothetical protein IMZ08_13700 [Bacillus luteolus]|uniref:Lipoprotein n=1 Tax=Litchfieldia luteola TaxID=682179 RepID=A0ABR9QKU4_9BACI|nr:hypothetical protein [Cytobacillus luteolus]MBE4909117.1 hypothetical protein [Cytobacillus luteolus]MBP1940432.1 putative small lipoprotein YifL [Cytobacillus luteolus]
MKRAFLSLLVGTLLVIALGGCAAGDFQIQNDENTKVQRQGNQELNNNFDQGSRTNNINQELQNRPGDSYLKGTDAGSKR